MSDAPQVELLVPQAIALRLVGTDAERVEHLKRRYGAGKQLPPYDVADMFKRDPGD
jgi:hypothetical protein